MDFDNGVKDNFLVIEVGSTTTVLSLFSYQGELLHQFQNQTTSTDITGGIYNSYINLRSNLDKEKPDIYATSSAAGGLKMTVHGLVYDMTVKAAKEAALGAGAVIHQVTAGEMDEYDVKRLIDIDPNIILLAGGVDFGEEDIIIKNAFKIKETGLNVPIVYAGNVACSDKIRHILSENTNIPVMTVENVYPALDELNVEPTRRAIQKVFQKHIIKGAGIDKLRKLTGKSIMPTPGAVFEGGKLLYELVGDLLVLDVGGATTDVHSFTEGSTVYQELLISPEPFSKRTVEGDLGVFKNAFTLLEKIKSYQVNLDFEKSFEILDKWSYIPQTNEEKKLLNILTLEAATRALKRHCGKIKYRYTASGRKKVIVGKDLSAIGWIVGAGGALTLQDEGKNILEKLKQDNINNGVKNIEENYLLPSKDAGVILDKNYILAAAGVVSTENKKLAKRILANYFMDTLNEKRYTGKVY